MSTGGSIPVSAIDVRRRIEQARNIGYFAAGAAANMAFLYDPLRFLPQIAASRTPREAQSYMSAILNRAGVRVREIEGVTIEAIAELAHTTQCRMFRQTLIGTIKKAQSAYDDIVLMQQTTRRVQQRRISIGFLLANMCVGAVGLASLTAGIVSFLVTNIALGGLKIILDFFCQLSEPMIAIGDRLTELIYEQHRLANKSV